jgi:hypothetical protein
MTKDNVTNNAYPITNNYSSSTSDGSPTAIGENAFTDKVGLEANTIIAGFDLAAIRLNQDFTDTFGVKKQFTRIPIRVARKDEYHQVHPSQEYQIPVVLVELKEENETYVLAPHLAGLLPGLARPALLFTAVDRHGNPFLPFVYLPGPDGKINPWHESRLAAIKKAQTCWLRCVANKALQGYELYIAEGINEKPKWPELNFSELIEIALRGCYIDDVNHPIVQQLLGRA